MKGIDYEGLQQYEIESWQESEISKIYPILRRGLFHTTSLNNYRGIRTRGEIVPNQGQFSFTYPQSQNSFAFSRNYVSLFDFDSVSDQNCIRIHHTWGSFFLHRSSPDIPVAVVLRLNRARLSQKLIPNSSAPKVGALDYKIYIPFLEAWYPEAIPFNAIDGFMIVMSRLLDNDPVFFEVTQSEVRKFENEIHKIELAWQDGLRGGSK